MSASSKGRWHVLGAKKFRTFCERCGQRIDVPVYVEHSDGRKMIVGMDCAATLEGGEGLAAFRAELSAARRALREKEGGLTPPQKKLLDSMAQAEREELRLMRQVSEGAEWKIATALEKRGLLTIERGSQLLLTDAGRVAAGLPMTTGQAVALMARVRNHREDERESLERLVASIYSASMG